MAIGSPNHVFGRLASNPSVPEKAAQGEGSRPTLRSVMQRNSEIQFLPPVRARLYLAPADVVTVPFTKAATGEIVVAIHIMGDIGIRRGQSFCVSTDAANQ
jgi:hypothetical protein